MHGRCSAGPRPKPGGWKGRASSDQYGSQVLVLHELFFCQSKAMCCRGHPLRIPSYSPSPPHKPLPHPGLQVWLDAGAVRAVKDKHKSLFAPGIVKVCSGVWGQLVRVYRGMGEAAAGAEGGGRFTLYVTPRHPEVTLRATAPPPGVWGTSTFGMQCSWAMTQRRVCAAVATPPSP